MVKQKTTNNLMALAAVVVILAVVGYGLGLIGGSEPETRYVQTPANTQAPNTQPGEGTPIPPFPPASIAPPASPTELTGDFNFVPQAAGGGAYSGSAGIYIVDSCKTREDCMNDVNTAGGAAGLKLKGSIAPSDTSVSSGTFSISPLSVLSSHGYGLFIYQDTTPAAGETAAQYKEIRFAGINPYLGTFGTLQWGFVDGTQLSMRLPDYGTMNWTSGGTSTKQWYTEYQAATVSNEQILVYLNATTAGGACVDCGLYLETNSGNKSNIVSVILTGALGDVVTNNGLLVDTSTTSDYRGTAAPTITTSGNSMYYVADFPASSGTTPRESNSQLNPTTIKIQYNHPSTGNWLPIFKVVQNVHAKSVANGHFDVSSFFRMNLTANPGTDPQPIGFN